MFSIVFIYRVFIEGGGFMSCLNNVDLSID